VLILLAYDTVKAYDVALMLLKYLGNFDVSPTGVHQSVLTTGDYLL